MLEIFGAASYAQATAGAHRFVVQAMISDMPLVIDAVYEEMGFSNGRMWARVGWGEESDARRLWKTEVLLDVCLPFVSLRVCGKERGRYGEES